jgi:hypothetical protein
MLPVKVQNNRVHVGERFSVSLQRSDRVEELTQPPVSRGQLPVRQLHPDLLRKLNIDISDGESVVVPCDEDEAVWMGFCGENSRRVALKIRQGGIDAVIGNDWDESLHEPQDYLVTPDQTSWYGLRSSDGHIRQFSRDPIELVVYEPNQPDDPPVRRRSWNQQFYGLEENPIQAEATKFPLVPDPKTITFWSVKPSGRVAIYFVDSNTWKSLTGEIPPPRAEGYSGTLLP